MTEGIASEAVWERLAALEAENKRLKAILCRETCDCDLAFSIDAEAVNPQNHAAGCLYVELEQERLGKHDA